MGIALGNPKVHLKQLCLSISEENLCIFEVNLSLPGSDQKYNDAVWPKVTSAISVKKSERSDCPAQSAS